MTQPLALKQLVGAQSTQDGQAMLLDALDAAGAPVSLAVPVDELLSLVGLTVAVHSAARFIQDVPRGFKHDLAVVGWELARVNGSTDVVLDLALRGGGTLSFRLDPAQQQGVHDALGQVMAGAAGG